MIQPQKPILFHHAWASSTRVVHLIHELGIADAIEIKTVKNFPANLQTPEYKALNPFGKVPVYKDGDFVLFESGAIILYLLDKYSTKAANLRLDSPKIRPIIYQFLFFGTTELFKYNGILYEHYLASDAEKQAMQSKVDKVKFKWKTEVIPFLEKTLDGKDYLCGEFSAADIAVFYDLTSMKFFGIENESKAVADYLERVQNRESYHKTFNS